MPIQLENLTINSSVKTSNSDNNVKPVDKDCPQSSSPDNPLFIEDIESIVKRILEKRNEY